MDPEHLDHWGTPEAMVAGYDQFVGNVPFYGFAVLCIDHPAVQQMIPRLSDRRIITYGFSPQADVRADRVVPDKLGSTFDVTVTDRARNRSRKLGPYRLPMLGAHNVQNALAAVAVGVEMEIDDDTLRSAFAGFRGVKRRFTKTGEAGGITVIDDYGHHPVEIAAVLKAARQAGARDVIAVVQPHRFTPAALAVQRVLHLHERCRHGHRRRCLSGRRGTDPGRDARCAGRWAARARPSQRGAAAVAGAAGGDGVRDRQAGRLRGVPRGGEHHAMGRGTAGRSGGAAGRAASRGARHDDGRDRRMPDFIDTLPPLRGRVQADAPLAPFTWFRVGGPAEALVRPADEADLAQFLRALPLDIPVHVIGACSNLIIRDGGLPGVVIRLARGFGAIAVEPDGVIAGAAALDVTVAEHAAAAGLTGLEFLSGIPGSIGGAVVMNGGAYGGDIASCLDWAEIVTRTGEQRRLAAADLAFAYRHSRLPHGAVVVRARLRARRGAPDGDRRAHGGDPRRARGLAAGARAHRRLHVPQSARHEGVGTDRRRRLPRPDPWRRAGVREALQLPDQHRHRDRGRPRGSWRGSAPPRACGDRCHAGMGDPAHRCAGRKPDSPTPPLPPTPSRREGSRCA